MAVLGAKGDLSAAEVAFFVPALLVSAFIALRHGFSRQQGWIYLVILSILRIIGAACILYLETHNTFIDSVYETAQITSSIGIAPLLLALIGFLGRVNEEGMSQGRGISSICFRLFQSVSLVALVLAIVGGTDETGQANSSTYHTGHELREAASIIFLALYVCCIGMTTYFAVNFGLVAPTEKKLVYGSLITLPFLGVRVLYTVLEAFLSADTSSVFYYRDINVYVQAFMQFLMEAVVVIVFVVAGIVTPKKSVIAPQHETCHQLQHDTNHRSAEHELESRGHGREGQQSGKTHRQEQAKGVTDYLPLHMLFNYLRNR